MKYAFILSPLALGTSALTTIAAGASGTLGADGIFTVMKYNTVTTYTTCPCGVTGTYNPTWTAWTTTSSTTSAGQQTSTTTSGTVKGTSTTSGTTSGTVKGTSTTSGTTTGTTSGATTTTSGTVKGTSSTTGTTSGNTSGTTSGTTTTPTTTTTTTTTTKPPSTTTTTTPTQSTTTTTTTGSSGPVVTDNAYIDTVMRHHNAHRSNHSANALAWSPTLAATAQKIAMMCQGDHITNVDGGGYGQNLGFGYAATDMGNFITEGLYNSEMPSYTAYGNEPSDQMKGKTGHFTAIVWKGTSTVGCYTYDCSSQGGIQGMPGFNTLTVCNYAPAGNVGGAYAANVGSPLGQATIHANYQCPSNANCADS